MANLGYAFFSIALALNFAASARAGDAAETPVLAGEIVVVQGKVMIRSEKPGPSFGVTRVAEAGGPIYPEDVINTSSLSKIKILLKDKSIVDLGPSSLFKVDHFDGASGTTARKVDLSMAYGTMRAAVTQKLENGGRFKVRTPSATMGVRGTEFLVQSDLEKNNKQNSTTEIAVVQGKVDVTSFRSNQGNVASPVVSLTPGMQLQTANFGPLASASANKPLAMNSSQLNSLYSNVKVSDAIFQKAVTVDPTQPQSGSRDPASSNGSKTPTISTSVAIPPPPPVSPADLGIPGAFRPGNAIAQTPVNPLGSLKRLHVVIQTP